MTFSSKVSGIHAPKVSCTTGWVKTVNHILFTLTTCICFALIMVTVISRERNSFAGASSKNCKVISCGIFCYNVNLRTDEFIADAVKDLSNNCFNPTLVLENAYFPNQTIPMYWLNNIGKNLSVLTIINGNMKWISPYAFFALTFRNLEILSIEGVTISKLDQNVLKGLDSILDLNIRGTNILEINENVLTAVGNSLITLKIQGSALWNPVNVTGGKIVYNLQVVDFTLNDFGNIIKKDTFKGISNCTLLYLSSSRITSIELGAFDYLYKINRITLSGNQLTTLPVGIFDHITTVQPSNMLKIDLQENRWQCDCNLDHLRKLVLNDYLMMEIVCITPPAMTGHYITYFESLCDLNDSTTSATYASTSLLLYNDSAPKTLNLDSLAESVGNIICPNLEDGIVSIPCNGSRSRLIDFNLIESYIDILANTTHEILLYFYNSNSLSLFLQLTIQNLTQYDLIWFRGECYEESACINSVSNIVHVPNIHINSSYTYCLVNKDSDGLNYDLCVRYGVFPSFDSETQSTYNCLVVIILVFIMSVMVSVLIGASSVCIAVRRNPVLLKGSKRVILVKHKTTNAFVLPEKFREPSSICERLPEVPSRIIRNASNVSTPSYVSAVLPTDEQLNVWRLSHECQTQYSIYDSLNVDNIYEDLITFKTNVPDYENGLATSKI